MCKGELKLLIHVNFVHLWVTCNIMFVTGNADDAALRSLRGDWKTYSRLRGLTIEVSSRVTNEDHENGAVSTSEGGAVSLPIKLLPRRCALLISILTFARIRRPPDFRSPIFSSGNAFHRLFLPICEGGTCECMLQSGNGSIEEIRKVSPSCISHHLR